MLHSRQSPLVFVAGPFTNALSGQEFDAPTSSRLRELSRAVREAGAEVFSSHEREDFGRALDHPVSLVEFDRRMLEQCTHFVAYVGAIESLGVWIELGLALGEGKPILVLHEGPKPLSSQFLEGLSARGEIQMSSWSEGLDLEGRIQGFLRGAS